ncbi:MAG: hypothetical protein NVS4B11_31640 [Ktedonobacteraceae bacterium]
MDILYLLDRLENLIASSRKMPLVNQIIIKEADILTIIDEMRAVIPDEIKQARRIVQDKERILSQANAEAANIATRTREESERVLSREGLLRAAEERSQDLVQRAEEQVQALLRQAEAHSEHLKVDADAYVSETLHNFKEHLMSIETEVSRTILSIERGLESIATQEVAGTNGEDEEYEEEYDDAEKELGPREIQPRRASLANDTIGGPTFPKF